MHLRSDGTHAICTERSTAVCWCNDQYPQRMNSNFISSHPCSIRSSAHFSSFHPHPCRPPALHLHPHPHLCTLPPFSPPHSDSLTNDPPLSGNIHSLSLGVRASALINPSFAELHQHEQEKFCGEKKDPKGFYTVSQCIPIITFKSPHHKTKPLHWWICVSLLLIYMWIFTRRRFHSHVYSCWPDTGADEKYKVFFSGSIPSVLLRCSLGPLSLICVLWCHSCHLPVWLITGEILPATMKRRKREEMKTALQTDEETVNIHMLKFSNIHDDDTSDWKTFKSSKFQCSPP